MIYGLKPNPKLLNENDGTLQPEQVISSLDQLYALRNSALTGAATAGLGLGLTHEASLTDWVKATSAPALWPVMGPITGAFGERIDPFNGEGAFHSGVDISCHYGQAGSGALRRRGDLRRTVQRLWPHGSMDHGNGITTRYGHLSGFAVAERPDGAPGPGHRLRRPQRSQHWAALALRSAHPRHAGESAQIPAQHNYQARGRSRRLGQFRVGVDRVERRFSAAFATDNRNLYSVWDFGRQPEGWLYAYFSRITFVVFWPPEHSAQAAFVFLAPVPPATR